MTSPPSATTRTETGQHDALATLSRADCWRLLDRVRELAELDQLTRERGTLIAPDEPVPLNKFPGRPSPRSES